MSDPKTMADAANKAVGVVDKVADELLKYLKDAVEYGKGQVPEVVEQFIKREAWEWGMWAVAWTVVFIVAVELRKWGSKAFDTSDCGDEGPVAAIVIGWVFTVVAPIGFFITIQNIGSIWIAPKVFVLEKLAEILKGVTY